MYSSVCQVSSASFVFFFRKGYIIKIFWFPFQYPYMVDFILVGPLTNFAMCINMYGDEFLSKIRNIYIMGGNYRGELFH